MVFPLLELTDDLLVHIFNLQLTDLRSWHRACWLACCNRRLHKLAVEALKKHGLKGFEVEGKRATPDNYRVRVHGVEEREEEDDGNGGVRVSTMVWPTSAKLLFSTRSANTFKPLCALKVTVNEYVLSIGLELSHALKYLERPQGWRHAPPIQRKTYWAAGAEPDGFEIRTTRALLTSGVDEEVESHPVVKVYSELDMRRVEAPGESQNGLFQYTDDRLLLQIDDIDKCHELKWSLLPTDDIGSEALWDDLFTDGNLNFIFPMADLRRLLGFDFTSDDPEQRKLRDHLFRIRDDSVIMPPPRQRYQGKRLAPPARQAFLGASSGVRLAREVLARTERDECFDTPADERKLPYAPPKRRLVKPDRPRFGAGPSAPRPGYEVQHHSSDSDSDPFEQYY